jgi:ComF family protein
MQLIQTIKEALLHLAFPHVCAGCGSDLLSKEHLVCLRCLEALPQTDFHKYPNNPVEKMFWGRLPLTHATAQYYFSKESLLQHLVKQFKYRGNEALAFYLGQLMGHQLATTHRFSHIDALIPLPLFAAKERARGYNQSTALCNGIADVMQKLVLNEVVIRTTATESQTKKNRIERWQNMEGCFELINAQAIAGKHVLLVDDVVTTGATLEACGRELLEAQNIQLSIATLCFSTS